MNGLGAEILTCRGGSEEGGHGESETLVQVVFLKQKIKYKKIFRAALRPDFNIYYLIGCAKSAPICLDNNFKCKSYW